MPVDQITIDELIAEMEKVQSALPSSSDGVSVGELVVAWGVHDELVRKRLRNLNKNGRLAAGKRRTIDIAGRPSWVPVYKIKGEEKGSKKR